MNQTPPRFWHEWGPLQSLGFVVGVLGGIAGIISILPLLFASRGDLQATYTHTRFAVPTYLLQPDRRDTALVRREEGIYKLYRNLLKQRYSDRMFSYPDSLTPSTLLKGAYGYSVPPIRDFAISNKGLIDLTVYNAGDKALTNLKVVYKDEVYYEFQDSNSKLQKGSAKGRFPIGDLDPKETRQVTMWTLQPKSYREDDVSLAYSDGIVNAIKPEELTGKSAWLIRNVFDISFLLKLSFAPMIFYITAFVRHILSSRKRETQ